MVHETSLEGLLWNYTTCLNKQDRTYGGHFAQIMRFCPVHPSRKSLLSSYLAHYWQIIISYKPLQEIAPARQNCLIQGHTLVGEANIPLSNEDLDIKTCHFGLKMGEQWRAISAPELPEEELPRMARGLWCSSTSLSASFLSCHMCEPQESFSNCILHLCLPICDSVISRRNVNEFKSEILFVLWIPITWLFYPL